MMIGRAALRWKTQDMVAESFRKSNCFFINVACLWGLADLLVLLRERGFWSCVHYPKGEHETMSAVV